MEQNNNTTEQPQEATTVGMFLKFTRQKQKKTIENVSKALCIRKIYIKAIEESNFDELPPIPYGVGFVRSYADFLGLNAERIVQCYKEEAMPKKNDSSTKPIIRKHTSLTMPNLKQILIGIFLVLGLYLMTFVFSYNNKIVENQSEELSVINISEETNILPTQEGFSEQLNIDIQDNPIHNDTVIMVEDTYEEVTQQPETEIAQNTIVVKFNGESWFEVKDDTKVYISGIYKKGFEYTLPNVPNLILSVGRYFNVDVFINGELVKVAGPKKQTNIKLDAFLNH